MLCVVSIKQEWRSVNCGIAVPRTSWMWVCVLFHFVQRVYCAYLITFFMNGRYLTFHANFSTANLWYYTTQHYLKKRVRITLLHLLSIDLLFVLRLWNPSFVLIFFLGCVFDEISHQKVIDFLLDCSRLLWVKNWIEKSDCDCMWGNQNIEPLNYQNILLNEIRFPKLTPILHPVFRIYWLLILLICWWFSCIRTVWIKSISVHEVKWQTNTRFSVCLYLHFWSAKNCIEHCIV